MPNPTPKVLELARRFRNQLLARERRAATSLVRYYGKLWADLQPRIQELRQELIARADAGEEITQSMVWRLERMKAIQAQAEQEMMRYAQFADGTISAGQRESIAAGERDSFELLRAYYPAGTDIPISFAAMPRAAVEAMVGTLADGSPIMELLTEAVEDAAADFAETMVSGLAAGWNPRRLARELRGKFGIGLTRSMRIARTEQLRAYRTASDEQYRQSGVVVEKERMATADDRTCMACFVDWKVPVLTSKGYRPIAKIEVGDLVLTHRGRFRPVTRLFRQPVSEAAIVVMRCDLPGGKQLDSLTMTVEHPVLTVKGWVEAGALSIGDAIAVPTKPCEVCGEPVLFRYKGGKTCSRSCVGKLAAAGLHGNPEAHARAVRNMTATHQRMFRDGIHPFLDPEIRKLRARRALRANSLLTSSRTEGVLAKQFDLLGLNYETQYPIPSHYNAKNNRHYHYYADFAFPDAMLVVEADGEPWHSWDQARIEHDRLRQQRIEAQGWMVLRYTGRQIYCDVEGIGEEVDAILKNHAQEYGTAWVQIKTIKRGLRKPPAAQFKVVRYNLEVDEDQSYVAKYAVVHNCIMLDGKRYPLNEPMDDHPMGRCVFAPITKTYAQMGIDAPEPDFTRQKGEDWFRAQDEATQRRMMGNAKWEAWQAGQFALADIPKLTENRTWGDSWTPASLADLVGE